MFDPTTWKSRAARSKIACVDGFMGMLEHGDSREWTESTLELHALLRERGIDTKANIRNANIKRHATMKAKGLAFGRPGRKS